MIKSQNLIRKNALRSGGFGIDAMKSITVCQKCSSLEEAGRMFCTKCGARLSGTSLYSIYKSQHKNCVKCGYVISDRMRFCSHCGKKVEW